MRISEWSWKNYKSYGNTKEVIKLSLDRGELILLVGENGAGKSSLIETLDLAIFGEVQNKQAKRLPQKNFPNRINGHMEVNVILETDEECNITRTMDSVGDSLKTKLVVGKVPYGKANKVDDKILEKIGFDYKTYKSFISMNVNNFKNFISLSPEEKRILLDKLFNLEMINDLNKILKQLQKNNEMSFGSIGREIQIYRENIAELESSIAAVKERTNNNKEQQLAELKALISSKKEAFTSLENEKTELDEAVAELQTGLNGLSQKVRDIDRDISDIQGKIGLYKSGKCPTCMTALVGDLNLLPEFEERLEKTQAVKEKVTNKIAKGKELLAETRGELSEVTAKYNAMLEHLSEVKGQINTIKAQADDNLDDFMQNVDTLNAKLSTKESEYLDIQKLKYVYDLLLPIWGESGIKRDIIDSIISPLNEYIAEDLVHLKTRFKVELDNNFDAHIFEWNQEIDPDSLSTGEARKINLIIMLAYIKMLRMKREINILFLDEAFASIDIKGIDDILVLFKKFANDRKINIFLVHHSELKEWFFDRVVTIKKGTFSYIEEKQINQ